jgi:hypothetical protein
MTELLKGNFQTKGKVLDEKRELTLEDQFEREALKRLGGSIAFVAKRKVVWTDEAAAETAHEQKSGHKT